MPFADGLEMVKPDKIELDASTTAVPDADCNTGRLLPAAAAGSAIAPKPGTSSVWTTPGPWPRIDWPAPIVICAAEPVKTLLAWTKTMSSLAAWPWMIVWNGLLTVPLPPDAAEL